MKSLSIDNKGQMLSLFIGLMLATILALQVTWPVIDNVLNSKTDTTVTGETFNVSGNEDVWMSLANADITSNSETVYNTTLTYAPTTDYVMNYTDGTIKPVSTGGFNFNISNGSTTYSIDYGHTAVTPIENLPASASGLVNLLPLFLMLTLVMVFIRPLM